MTVQNVGKNSVIWDTFLVFEVLILLIVPSAVWEEHLTEGDRSPSCWEIFLEAQTFVAQPSVINFTGQFGTTISTIFLLESRFSSDPNLKRCVGFGTDKTSIMLKPATS